MAEHAEVPQHSVPEDRHQEQPPPMAPVLLPRFVPPGLPKRCGHASDLRLHVLWWVGRARGIGPMALADLCQSTPAEVQHILTRYEKAECLRRVRVKGQREEALLLTNKGLAVLANEEQLPPGRVAAALGWQFSRNLWKEQGPADTADKRTFPGYPLRAHDRAVYELLGRAAYESRAPEFTFWGLRLSEVMLEHEVAKYNNYLGPQPDVCLIWRVRQSLKFRYFVEYETGSHRPTMAAAKLRHYGWYAGTEECQATWERIPCILFVVPDLGYETQLARAVLLELRQLQTRVPVLMTHQGLLERHRLLDPIWRAGGMHAVSADGRATCWGKENNELLLHEKSEDYLARASRKNLL